MGNDLRNGSVPDYAVRRIRTKARTLVGRYGFSRSDQPDIEQQLALEVWRRLPRHDHTKGSLESFLYWVVERAVATIIEHRTAAKRDCRRNAWSLDGVVEDPEGGHLPLTETIEDTEAGRRLGLSPKDSAGLTDLTVEVRDFLTGLHGDLRELCLCLLDGQSFTEISRQTGVPRATLYERREELSRLMEAAGLREYHPSSGASPRPPVGNQ